jgi:hypothetical protein
MSFAPKTNTGGFSQVSSVADLMAYQRYVSIFFYVLLVSMKLLKVELPHLLQLNLHLLQK